METSSLMLDDNAGPKKGHPSLNPQRTFACFYFSLYSGPQN